MTFLSIYFSQLTINCIISICLLMGIRCYEGVNLINLGWKYATNPHVKFTGLYIIKIFHLKTKFN